MRKVLKEEQKRKEIEEEQRFEAKLARDREELAMRERSEKEEAENKVKKARQQNQQLMDQKKHVEVVPVQITAAVGGPMSHRIQREVIFESKPQEDKTPVPQSRRETNASSSEIHELQQSFKGELQSMRKVIKE